MRKSSTTSLYFCPFHMMERQLTRIEAEWLLKEIVALPETDGLLRLKGTVPAAEGGFWAAEGSVVLYFITRRAQAAGISQLVERLFEELSA